MDVRSEVLIERLERLERSNGWMKAIGAAFIAAVVGLGAVPHSKAMFAPVFRARAFELVDANDKVLAALGPSGANKEAGLFIFDRNGTLRTFAGVSGEPSSADNSGFTDWDANGALRSFSGSIGSGTFDGNSGHYIFDQTGAIRTGLHIDYFNNFLGAFALEASGTNRVGLGTALSGNVSFLTLFDASGQERASFNSEDSAGNLILRDPNGAFRAGLLVDNSCCGGIGSDLLFFNNPTGDETGMFYSDLAGGTYTTFDGVSSPAVVTGTLP